MKQVAFTQFLFPDRRPSPQWIERPDHVAEKAETLQKAGYKFEIENNNGAIWMSISHHGKEEHADRFCQNGPAVPGMVDDLIEEAYRRFIC